MAIFSSLPDEDRQRILGKLAKLKALSECKTGNVNETATAAAAMTRLMLEYQIEMAELHPGDPPDGVVEEEVTGEVSRRGFPRWQVILLTGLAKAQDCISYTQQSRSYGFFVANTECNLRIIGTREDIQTTRNLYSFCLQEIERLCLRWNRRAPIALKNDFRMGAAIGICEKVRLEREAVMAEERARAAAKRQTSQALALFDQKLEAVEDRGREIGLKVTSTRARAASPNAYAAGYQAGSAINLSGQAPPILGERTATQESLF